MSDKIVFLVTRPYEVPEHADNVIVAARDRESAKKGARHILGGEPDYYVVTPITERGTRTAFVLEAN